MYAHLTFLCMGALALLLPSSHAVLVFDQTGQFTITANQPTYLTHTVISLSMSAPTSVYLTSDISHKCIDAMTCQFDLVDHFSVPLNCTINGHGMVGVSYSIEYYAKTYWIFPRAIVLCLIALPIGCLIFWIWQCCCNVMSRPRSNARKYTLIQDKKVSSPTSSTI